MSLTKSIRSRFFHAKSHFQCCTCTLNNLHRITWRNSTLRSYSTNQSDEKKDPFLGVFRNMRNEDEKLHEEEVKQIKKMQEYQNKRFAFFRNVSITKEEMYPNITHLFPNADSRQRFRELVEEFQKKNNIEEDMYAHFEALKKFESSSFEVDQFLMGDEFDFGDEDNLTQYLKALSLMHGTHDHNVNQDEAMQILRDLEQKEYAPALETLAILSYDEENSSVALEYHKRAAKKGFLESCLNYGAHLLENPLLEEEGDKSGVEYVLQAANAESVAAMEQLSRTFYFGSMGVGADFDLCFAWASTAMKYGSLEGTGYAGLCEIQGFGTRRNIDHGRALVEEACEAGMLDITGQYGILLVQRLGEMEKGVQLLEEYVDSGACIPEFYANLATLYLVKQAKGSLKRIMELFESGANMYDSTSISALARLYETGLEHDGDKLEPNLEKAVEYHLKNVQFCRNQNSFNTLLEWKEQGKTEVDIEKIVEEQLDASVAAFEKKFADANMDPASYELILEQIRNQAQAFKENARTSREMKRMTDVLSSGKVQLISDEELKKIAERVKADVIPGMR